jgi:hypothetical protein
MKADPQKVYTWNANTMGPYQPAGDAGLKETGAPGFKQEVIPGSSIMPDSCDPQTVPDKMPGN